MEGRNCCGKDIAFSPQSQCFLLKVDNRLLITTSYTERSGTHVGVLQAHVTHSVSNSIRGEE
jgi:hypothetical protein